MLCASLSAVAPGMAHLIPKSSPVQEATTRWYVLKLVVRRPGDQLLVNKQHAELLQPYHQRMDTAVAYMKAIRPCPLEITGGALLDPQVHCGQ